MPESPEHGYPVILIEQVARVNEKKNPILLLLVFIPEETDCIDGTLYPRLQSYRKLHRSAGGLGLRPGHLQ